MGRNGLQVMKKVSSQNSDLIAKGLVAESGDAKVCTLLALKAGAFERLLDMAGPEMATALILQYQTDLADVQTKMKAGLSAKGADGAEWALLQTASHVLIALAGTAGDDALTEKARTLNNAANASDAAGTGALAPAVLQGLAALIAFVDQTAIQRGAVP